jgi:UDP-glucose 4-epimerase
MKVLVTGGAGFIGSHIVDALVARGHQPVVYDNLCSGNLRNLKGVLDRIEFVEADIRDLESLLEASRNCELAFHLAAMVSVPQTVEDPLESCQINEAGTLNLFEACKRNGTRRVVFSSSCAVYGDAPGLPKREDMPAKPPSPYAVQKLAGEHYAIVYNSLYGLETVCLRYFNVFGPRQDPSSPYSGVISIFMTKAARKEAPVIYGDGCQTRDFIFVADVVQANLLASETPEAAGHVFNIGNGAQVSVNRLWEMICEAEGIRIAPEYAPPRSGDILESEADIASARKILGFSPRHSVPVGLKTTSKWYAADQAA